MVHKSRYFLVSICLMLPFMTGCTTMMTVNAGKRSEVVLSFDQVQQSDDRFLVQYTIGTNSLWHKNIPQEQRIHLLIPEENISQPLGEMPDWGKTVASIPVRRASSSCKIEKADAQKQAVAYVVEDDLLVIVEPSSADTDVDRVEYRPDRARYRKWWGYPICMVGTPLAVAVDIGLLPIQIVVFTTAANHALSF